LQAAFGTGDQPDRDVEIGEPERRAREVIDMIKILLDVLAAANAPAGRDKPDSGTRLDHTRPPTTMDDVAITDTEQLLRASADKP
jgi:hypothetical protein